MVEHIPERGAVILGAAVLGRGDLQRILDGRQRAAEFVGRVSHELMLAFHVAGHLVEQPVDCQRQPVEFVGSPLRFQAIPQPRRFERLRRAQNFAQRLRGPQGEPVAGQRCQQRQPQPDRQEETGHPIDFRIERQCRHPDPDIHRSIVGIGDPASGKAVAANLPDLFHDRLVDRFIEHLLRAVVAAPHRRAGAIEQLHKPTPLLMALRFAAQFADEHREIGVEFVERQRNLPHLSAQGVVELVEQGRPHAHADRRQNCQCGQQHHGGIEERQSHPQRGPGDRFKQS